MQTLEAIATNLVVDQVDLSYGTSYGTNGSARCVEDGHVWGSLNATPPYTHGCITVEPANATVRDASGNVIIEGLSQHDNPFFYLALLVMVATAVAQVKYLNLGMSLFGNSEVSPSHCAMLTPSRNPNPLTLTLTLTLTRAHMRSRRTPHR